MRTSNVRTGRKVCLNKAVSAVIEQMEQRVLLAATPATPGVPDLIEACDSGVSSSDNITAYNNASGRSLVFSVPFVTSGNTVYVEVDGVVRGNAIASGTTAQVTLSSEVIIGDGSHTITAYQSNGRNSAASTALTITIDTTAPAAPAAPVLQASSDSGISSSDGITNVASPIFNVTASPYFRLYRDGALVSSGYQTGSTYTSSSLADRAYNFTLAAVDEAGNESARSNALAVTIDTVAPAATLAPDLQATSDSGYSSTDNVTNVTSPVLTISASPYFQLYRNGSRVGGIYQSGSSSSDTVPADGTYSYTVTVLDAAGNESPQSMPVAVTIDTLAPAAPPAPDLQANSDSGVSNTDNITNAQNLYFDVSASPYFRFYDGANLLSPAYRNMTWYYASAPAEGIHLYRLSAVDAAGNESLLSTLQVTVDRTAVAPTIDLQAASDSGISNTDNITNARTPSVDLIAGEAGTIRWQAGGGATQTVDTAGGASSVTIDGDRGAWGSTVQTLSGSTGGEHIAAGDFDGDGLSDIVVLLYGSGSTQLFKGDGVGGFAAMPPVAAGMTWVGNLVSLDLNGDAYRDLIVIGNGTRAFYGCADGIFTPGSLSLNGLFSSAPPVVADFNSDGLADLAIDMGTKIYLLTASSAGVFPTLTTITTPAYILRLQAADLTGDGCADLVTTYSDTGQVVLFAATAGGGFASPVTIATISGARAAIPGDFTNDGKLDLAITTYATTYLLPGNGDGTFAAAIGSSTPYITARGAVDLDGDGFLDLYGSYGGPAVSYGDGAGHFTGTIGFGGLAAYTDIVVGDFTPAKSLDVLDFYSGQLEISSRVNGLPDGDRTISATLLDLAGNTSSYRWLTIQVDTIAQGSYRPTLTTATDTGTSSSDGLTNADSIVAQATTANDMNAGSSFILDGTTAYPATPESNTFFSTIAGLAEGVHTAVFTRTDIAGNTYTSSPLTITIDRTAPTGTALLSLNTDTGVSGSDWITSTATPTIYSGTGRYRTYVDGVAIGDRGAGSLTLPSMSDGDHLVEVALLDGAGNAGPRTGRTITIDTVAPDAPAAPDLTDASDSGISNTDNLTNVKTPTLSFSGFGAYYRLYRDSTLLLSYGTATTYTSPMLADGTYTYRLVAIDAAGNPSAESSLTITIDTAAPSAPVLLDLTDASDSGMSSTDNITRVTTPMFAFTASPYFRFYDGATVLAGGYNTGSSYTASAQAEGTHTYGISAVDAAGNESVKATLAVTIDTIAPSATLSARTTDDSGISSTDGITNITTPTLLLSSTNYYILQQDGVDLSGAYTLGSSYVMPAMADGSYSMTARLSDVAGNTAVTNAVSLTIDTAAPAVPTGLDLVDASDSGVSNTDNLTNVKTPSFAFTAGSYFRFYAGTTRLSPSYASGSSFTTTVQTDGARTYGISAVDVAGNESAKATLDVTIDTIAPAVPLLDLPDQYDTGVSNTDNITRLRDYTVTVSSGPYLRLVRQGAPISDDYGTQTAIAETGLPDGSYAYQAYARDAAGNESVAGNLTVTVDTTMPVPAAPVLLASSDTGVSSTDNITNDNTPTFAAVLGFEYRVYLDGTSVTPYLSAGTQYTAEALADGQHQIAFQYREGTAESVVGSALTITIDTAAPAMPAAPNLAASSDTGISSSDNITNIRSPKLSLPAVPKFRLYRDGVLVADNVAPDATATQLQSGTTQNLNVTSWMSGSMDALLQYAGRNVRLDFSFDTVNATSNNYEGWYIDDVVVSGDGVTPLSANFETGPQGFRVDNSGGGLWHLSTGRAGDAGHSPSYSFYYGQGESTAGGGNYNTGAANRGVLMSPEFTLPANARITWKHFLNHDHGPYTDLAVLKLMEVTRTFTLPLLADGTYQYSIAVMDDAGNWSAPGPATAITIDTVAPAALTASILDPASDTGISNTDGITNNNRPTFNVSDAQYFRVYRSGDLMSGLYQNTPWTSGPLADGSYNFSATAVDVAGNVSPFSPNRAIVIDTTPPATPAAPDLHSYSDSGTSKSDNITNDTTPLFDVSGAPYFRFYRDGTLLSGNYQTGSSYTLTTQADGTYAYSLVAVDAAGNISGVSPTVSVTIDTVAPAAPTAAPTLLPEYDTGISDHDGITSRADLKFLALATDGYGTLLVNNFPQASIPAGGGTVSYTAPATSVYSVVVAATDLAGNAAYGPQSWVTVLLEAPRTPKAPRLAPGSDTGVNTTDNLTAVANPTITLPALPDEVPFYTFGPVGSTSFVTQRDPHTGRAVRCKEVPLNLWNSWFSGYSDMAQDRTNLYLVTDETTPQRISRLYTINQQTLTITNVITLSGVNGRLNGLAMLNGVLYTTQHDALYRIDVAAGTTVLIGRGVPSYDERLFLSAAPDRGTLLATTSLYGTFEINPSNGTVVQRLPVTGLDALTHAYLGEGKLAVIKQIWGGPTLGLTYSILDLNTRTELSSIWDPSWLGQGVAAGDGIAAPAVQPWYRVFVDGVQVGGDYLTPGEFTLPELADGSHTVTLVAVDAAGNMSLLSDTLSITTDTVAPAAPVAPTLQATSDSGVSSTDRRTNVRTPAFDLPALDAGEQLRVYRNGVEVGPGPTVLSSFTDDLTALTDGDYSYTVRLIDAAGNLSVPSTPLVMHLDTAAPAAPVITINAGAAQRSMVTQIDVAFSESVALAANAFQLLLHSGSLPPNTLLNVTNPSGDGQNYHLTFSGSAIIGKSLADGIYELFIGASAIEDLAGNHLATNSTRAFHRLYGDADGSGNVSAIEALRMKATTGTREGQGSYISYFDHDANGSITAMEYLLFKKRVGTRFIY